jgi:hypothetical protein
MKRIEKGLSPAQFEKWKSLANDEWTPTFDVELTDAELALVLAAFVTRDDDGRFPDFGHVIAHFATQITAQT